MVELLREEKRSVREKRKFKALITQMESWAQEEP